MFSTRRRLAEVLAVALFIGATLVPAPARAEGSGATDDSARPGAAAREDESSSSPETAASDGDREDGNGLSVRVDGTYSVWGLLQRNFFLGRDHSLDDAKYVVQNFRLKFRAGHPRYGGVLRADFAQGWWGADNKPNVDRTATAGPDGDLEQSDRYNPYGYFRKKGTHYDIHVDHAYVYLDVPRLPIRLELGRRHHAVGNRLVLDQDLDGVFLKSSPTEDLGLRASWAKVSEGFQSFKAPRGTLMSDDGRWGDADLYGLRGTYDGDRLGGELFALYYNDDIDPRDRGWAYYPQGTGYYLSRFQPQISWAAAAGLRLDGALPVGRKLTYDLEFDYLFGVDRIDNDDYAGNLLDKNNGRLRGYNLYANLTQKFHAGVPLRFGLLFGLGSGDPDPTDGPGNINRIQTQGYFSMTNVWEDSVMPDVGGITPQGLGSPASRGYRELENTTALQFRVGTRPADSLDLEASYTLLQATTPVHGWNSSGPTDRTARHLGQELDLNLKWTIYEHLKAVTLGGIFFPGTAASLLINGRPGDPDPAWELKQVLVYEFST